MELDDAVSLPEYGGVTQQHRATSSPGPVCALEHHTACVVCAFLSTPSSPQRNVPAHIRWRNDLKDAAGAYLPHILRDSIDQTIHWANPAVGVWSCAGMAHGSSVLAGNPFQQ